MPHAKSVGRASDGADAPRAVERFARGRPAGVVLVLIILGACLPGFFTIPVVDRDEARFAQASRQMMESWVWPAERLDRRPITRGESGHLSGGFHAGSWAVPMVGDRPRLAKPPLIYWLQASSGAVLSDFDPLADRVWHYRVPSLLSAVAACLITWRLGVALGWARAGWLAGVLLGVCPMVVWDAHQARADQLLLATTTAAMAALMRIWVKRDAPTGARHLLTAMVFWLAIGAGVLTKGPITPMIALLAAIAVSAVARQWRWLRRTRPGLGLLVVAAMVGPWVMATADAVGWNTLTVVWLDETLGRSATPKEGHWGPPGYHLVLLAVLFWPGSLLTLDALRGAVGQGVRVGGAGGWLRRWRARTPGDDAVLFLLAWIGPAWLVFELVGTKLPHYTLPLYPPVALLTARAVVAAGTRSAGAMIAWPGLVLWVLIGLGLTAAAPGIAITLGAPAPSVAWACIGAAVGAGLIVGAAVAARRGRPWRVHLLAVGASLALSATLLQAALPGARDLRVTAELGVLIASAPSDAPVATADYREDSLTFITRARLETIRPDNAEAWASVHPRGVLILPAGSPGPEGWEVAGRVRGVNYSKGEPVDVRVWTPAGQGRASPHARP